MPLDVQIGDVVQMRKGHPCGSSEWQVYRVGADIGLRCLGCARRVVLPRRQFEKALKRRLSRAGEPGEQAAHG